MTEKKRKFRYWFLKILSVFISCALPIYAVCEHFPLWVVSYGTSRSVGAGFIISLLIITIIFRKSVFQFMQEKLNLKHAPPLMVWLIMLTVSYILLYLNQFIRDLTTVFWSGLLGSVIGSALTFAAENVFGKKKGEGDG